MKNKLLKDIKDFIKLMFFGYVFLAMCNWDYNPNNWNGFSHFLSASYTAVLIFGFFEMRK